MLKRDLKRPMELPFSGTTVPDGTTSLSVDRVGKLLKSMERQEKEQTKVETQGSKVGARYKGIKSRIDRTPPESIVARGKPGIANSNGAKTARPVRGFPIPPSSASLVAELETVCTQGASTVPRDSGWGVGQGGVNSARAQVLSQGGVALLKTINVEATTVALPPSKSTTVNRRAPKAESKFDGPKDHAIFDVRAVAAEKAQKRLEEAKRQAKLRQDMEDRDVHRKMMQVFANRTDNTLQARNQLRNIQLLLKEASVIGRHEGDDTSSSSESDDDDEEDEEEQSQSKSFMPIVTYGDTTIGGGDGEDVDAAKGSDGMGVSARSAISARSRKINRKLKKIEDEKFVDMITGTTKGGLSQGLSSPGGEENTETSKSTVPKKKLRFVYEGDDAREDTAQEELDSDPNIYTDPKRVYERQHQTRSVHDEIDPVKLQGRYAGALIGAPPSFNSASLSRIMETAVTDAIEQRLASEGLLRIVTDPVGKNWKVGSLDGEIARLMFHATRLNIWCEAAHNQVPLYYTGGDVIKTGSIDEVMAARGFVLEDKDAILELERRIERQQKENDELRRSIGALKDEYLVKQFAMQVNSATPDLESVAHANAFLKTTPQVSPLNQEVEAERGAGEEPQEGSELSASDAKYAEYSDTKVFVPGEHPNVAYADGDAFGEDEEEESTSALRQITSTGGAPGAAPASNGSSPGVGSLKTKSVPEGPLLLAGGSPEPATLEKQSALVWQWSLTRLQVLLGQRRTNLTAALRVTGASQVTNLVSQRDIRDRRPKAEIKLEIGEIDVMMRELAPEKAPTHIQAVTKSISLKGRTGGTTSPSGNKAFQLGSGTEASAYQQTSELNEMASKLRRLKQEEKI